MQSTDIHWTVTQSSSKNTSVCPSVRPSVRPSVCRQGFRNFLKKLLTQFISYLALTLMGWVSWPLFIFVSLASFLALWWPNIWPKMGFPELFEKTIGSIHFIRGIYPYVVSLLTPIHFRVPSLIFGPLVAKYLAENGVSGTFFKKLLAQFISYVAFTLMWWVSWPLYIFLFLASFSALWWPNIWLKIGFPELFSCDQAALRTPLSVRQSVCLSHLFHYVPVDVSTQNFQELLPMTKVMSMQKVKVTGQRSRSQRS